MKKKIVAVIPVRAGSKGLVNKNTRLIFKKSLLQWNIELLKEIQLIDRIIVSTDSHDIAEVAKKAGAEVPFLRPAELATDFATTEDTLHHVLLWLIENEGYNVDILVYQQVNDLFKKKQWIEECINILMEDDFIDTAFVAKNEHKNYWIEKNGKCERVTHFGHVARQLKGKLYREDTGLACATRARLLLEEKRRIGDHVKILPHDEFTIDIHDEFDLNLAKIIIENFPRYKKILENYEE